MKQEEEVSGILGSNSTLQRRSYLCGDRAVLVSRSSHLLLSPSARTKPT